MSTTCTAAWIDVAAARHLGEPVESLVGHLGDADVRILGGERIRRGERAAAGEGVVQRALPGVGEADQAEAFHSADDATGALATVPEVRWGLSLSLSEELADPRVVAEVAPRPSEAGWDGIFVWDHLWNRTYEPFADPWVTLAAVATATERVRIGTMVLALPRRRVQLVAQAATSLDRLSGGRLVLSLGLGVDSYGEYSVVRRAGLRRQGARRALDAGIELLVPMLEGGPVPQLGGRRTTAAGVQQPRPPIWIAGVTQYTAGPAAGRSPRVGGPGARWRGRLVTGDGDDGAGRGRACTGFARRRPRRWRHADLAALEAAGATWCIPEIEPGETAADALSLASTRR